MPKQTQVFSLFLAGAGDVKEEQTLVGRITEEWNLENWPARQALISISSWRSSAYPDSGNEPQQLINKQLLDHADIIVGIFWTRFGTPTSAAQSGTLEEIERGMATGKKVMIYFSDRDISPSTLDAQQYSQILAFKKKYAEQGLYCTYKSLDEFALVFRRHLGRLMNEMLGPPSKDACSSDDNGTEILELGLPVEYWILVLAAVERLAEISRQRIEQMRTQGLKVEDVDPNLRHATIGPVILRARLIDFLSKYGVIKPDLAARAGLNALLKSAPVESASREPN
ncbi:MAG: hypothetical protein JOY62_13435 [Acidobacteriaceae bacterium]|nr:hypothetical protein [Acidobacteriaceae bacterium]MBV9780964.1 hypothetical protein [Acidobacteriaceae bacterium]